MADLLRQAERARSDAGAPTAVAEVLPVRGPEPEPEPARESGDEAESTIPFIEVGDVYAPAIRLVRPADEGAPPPIVVMPPTPAVSPTEGLLTVRFQPVRAGQLSGRGFGPELVAYHDPEHEVSGQYRSLVAEITAQLPGAQPRALAVTAAAPQAGASTVVLNLALTLARQDENRVVVVDAHPDRPALAAKLGLSAKPGLREVLARHTPLAWSLQETAQANLLALAAGEPATPWAGDELPGVLKLLRGRADWVLVDAGPWDGSATAAVAEACDAVFLVMRHATADTPDATRVQAAILEATGRLRGCIVTQR
jgi:Mrp family chromosome partitioning ATPase